MHGAAIVCGGRDFGDFLLWRRDDVPSYQLAVVVDDAAMQVTEVVRAQTCCARPRGRFCWQRALGLETPGYYHCPLLTDENGVRLAKAARRLELARVARAGPKCGRGEGDALANSEREKLWWIHGKSDLDHMPAVIALYDRMRAV